MSEDKEMVDSLLGRLRESIAHNAVGYSNSLDAGLAEALYFTDKERSGEPIADKQKVLALCRYFRASAKRAQQLKDYLSGECNAVILPDGTPNFLYDQDGIE